MRTGSLKKRITIQQSVDTQNTYGEPVPTWSTVTTVWAKVEPLAGREFITAKQLAGKLDTRFIIRYRHGLNIKPKMKIVYDNNDYDIDSVININAQGRELHIMCNRVIT